MSTFDFYSLFDIFQQCWGFSIRGSHVIVDCSILLLDIDIVSLLYCIIVCITLNLFIIAQDLLHIIL